MKTYKAEDVDQEKGNSNARERKCLNCGMPQSRWKGYSGTGYPFGGEVYCCRGCAEAAGCICVN